MKMSEMFRLIERCGSFPVTSSPYLHPESIMFIDNQFFVYMFDERIFIVGKWVYSYLSCQDELSVSGWSWYRALHLGLKRPYVSIG